MYKYEIEGWQAYENGLAPLLMRLNQIAPAGIGDKPVAPPVRLGTDRQLYVKKNSPPQLRLRVGNSTRTVHQNDVVPAKWGLFLKRRVQKGNP